MLIVRIWDGLGNQMFQYAYARALKEKGRDVRIDLKKAYNESLMKNKKRTYRCNAIQNYRITIPELDVESYGKYKFLKKETILDKIYYWMSTHSLSKYKFFEEKDMKYSKKSACLNGNYYIKGWFQNEEYFIDIREILLKEFTPRKKILMPKKLRFILNNEESVSIHIRRGDYIKMQNSLSLFYYYKAISYIKTLYKNPIFLIFSDDIKWVKKNLNISDKMIFVNEDGKFSDFEELFIMSKCNSNIIANSTFSWWAAWLNTNENKHVIAPKKWFPSQCYILPSSWIII